MGLRFLADEHVPRVFTTVLRSNGYTVREAQERFGQRSDDRRILSVCAERDFVVLTNDRDFLRLSDAFDHAGLIMYSDWSLLLDLPVEAAEAIARIDRAYPAGGLRNEVEWLDGWLSV